MKKLLIATALAAISTGANAAQTTVQDVYKTVTVDVPQQFEGCHTVDVPVIEKRSGSAGEAITGAIIGGVIGNQFGNGSGKDAMTVIGALIGANAADNKEHITHYRKEERCTKSIIYHEEKKKVYSHSVIKFFYEGKWYTLEFQK